MKLIDLTGKRFGRLVVIKRYESLHGKTRWLCKCDCGKECVVHGTSLKKGNTTSCGCYRIENAKTLYSSVRQNDKRLYAVWNGIKQRCTNRNNKSYKNYGGRGIQICQDWSDNYESFYNWAISSGYKKGLQIDRIDNNGSYCPENCHWVEVIENANNKRNVKLFTINGITKSLPQWCKEYNQDYSLINQRVYKLGWDIETALKTHEKGVRMIAPDDLTGKRFGCWTVIEKDESYTSTKTSKWICKCDCGTIKSVFKAPLVTGRSKSCGCHTYNNK